MARATLIEPARYRVMPWRNGQGSTAEIAIEPGEAGRFRWRLSLADVAQSGPFSDFAGYERIIALASGAGMRLEIAGRAPAILDTGSEPYAFPGEATAQCTLLAGPVRNLNLIYDRAACRGTLAALRFAGAPLRPTLATSIALLHAAQGALEVEVASGERLVLPEGATLRIDEPEGAPTVRGAAGARAFLALVSARDATS